MTARRALVVDDSRSARAFLTRILERHELTVDAVESAEEAIEYLRQQRPDVIFMDHLMPGMDGFQAVQAIKSNPHTATIPIMMYTSQEGELYLSQARALGAIGVLPKQIQHADVSKALEQLRLYPAAARVAARAEGPSSARTGEVPALSLPRSAGASPAPGASVAMGASVSAGVSAGGTAGGAGAGAAGARAADQLPSTSNTGQYRPPRLPGGFDSTQERRSPDRPDLPALSPELRPVLEAMLAHHGRELRRFVVDNLETQADRILGDMRLLLQDSVSEAPAPPPAGVGRSAAPWLAAAGFILAAIFGVLWWQRSAQDAALSAQLAHSQQQLALTQQQVQTLQLAAARAQAQAAQAAQDSGAGATEGAAGAGGKAGTTSMVETVPFGEEPLAGARVEKVSQMLAHLTSEGFHGVVQIRSFPGRYCMVSGPAGAMTLPGTALPYSKCDTVGNPRDEDDSSERQSIAFANMLSTARANAPYEIQISSGGPDEVALPYPAVTDALTAGDWNRVAAANNRVELHWQAATR
jgi:CheY-like chemotaxis protein